LQYRNKRMTTETKYLAEISETVQKQHRFFNTGTTREVSFRIDQLKKLRQLLEEHEEEIYEALKNDFKKPRFETFGTELMLVYDEIDHAVKHIKSWSRPEKVRDTLFTFPSKNYIYRQPYGVVLVIGAWNYPIQLCLNPAVGALAAGNCVIIKPSEFASHSSSILKTIINQHFEEEYLHVIEGEAEEAQQLLNEPLDYIFYTGSTRVGKIVMEAGARQLTPVTLEMGGKSPAIVDETADLETTAKRIAWGKFINAGQTCVAPDYLYAHEDIKPRLVQLISDAIHTFFGQDPAESPDYARIINTRRFNRLKTFLDNGQQVTGGETNEEDLYIAPTVLDGITWDDPVMQEEVFGPILPVLAFNSLETVTGEINRRPAPLSLYYFTENTTRSERIIEKVRFGGGCINDIAYQFGNRNLPFGGIGESGIGKYHGRASFELFSHKKSILKKSTWPDLPIRYAPYEGKLKWLKKLFG